MKKQIIILLLFSIQLSAQNRDPNPHFPKLKISVPCNDDFLDNFKGKWLVPDIYVGKSPGSNFAQELRTRINQVHELVKQTYPEPTGADAFWTAKYFKRDFAYTVKFVTIDGETHEENLKSNQEEGWRYGLGLSPWYCRDQANELWNGYPEVGLGDAITIYINELPVVPGEFFGEDGWTIDDRPIKTRMPVVGKLKGYDVFASNGGSLANLNNEWFILITRNNMLPYIPVTKKQYLERAIAWITKFYDKQIAINDQYADQEHKEENKKTQMKLKDIALKKLQNELQKTTNEGQLNAPAVVRRDAHFQTEGPIFLPESEGGVLLTTENPDYFRKDLPGYMSQFIVFSWSGTGTKKWEKDFRKAFEENFPIERLQAMIDK